MQFQALINISTLLRMSWREPGVLSEKLASLFPVFAFLVSSLLDVAAVEVSFG